MSQDGTCHPTAGWAWAVLSPPGRQVCIPRAACWASVGGRLSCEAGPPHAAASASSPVRSEAARAISRALPAGTHRPAGHLHRDLSEQNVGGERSPEAASLGPSAGEDSETRRLLDFSPWQRGQRKGGMTGG